MRYKGIQIKYTLRGTGEPIVFLHGFLENCSMWDDIISHFEHNFQCVSIDLLGHGETACLGYIHTMKEMAEAVKAVLDHLEVQKVVVIGHSMGGYVALELISLYDSLIDGIILLNSTSYPDNEQRKLNRNRAIDLVKRNPNAYTGMAISNLFAPDNREKYKKQITNIKQEASKTSLQGIIAALEGMKIRKNHIDTLKKFHNKKLIISGKTDPVLSYKQNVKESLETYAEIVALEGGHMSYIENKKQVIEAIKKCLMH